MPKEAFVPEKMWNGEEVFIIGGGPSLRDFDWSLLEDEHTIGCNNAFRLGPKVCDVVFFSDRHFILKANKPREGFFDELANFPGLIVTNDTQLCFRNDIPWIKWMPRKPHGLHYDAIGYNMNSGAGAINLALLFGAKTVYLLGFDMDFGPKGETNWHDHIIDNIRPEVYGRMLSVFGRVTRDLPEKFPDAEVINITSNSKLDLFPKVSPEKFWRKRKCLPQN